MRIIRSNKTVFSSRKIFRVDKYCGTLVISERTRTKSAASPSPVSALGVLGAMGWWRSFELGTFLLRKNSAPGKTPERELFPYKPALKSRIWTLPGRTKIPQTHCPPKSCIPSRAKTTMNRKSRKSKLMMDFMEFSKETTRFLREFQYLRWIRAAGGEHEWEEPLVRN